MNTGAKYLESKTLFIFWLEILIISYYILNILGRRTTGYEIVHILYSPVEVTRLPTILSCDLDMFLLSELRTLYLFLFLFYRTKSTELFMRTLPMWKWGKLLCRRCDLWPLHVWWLVSFCHWHKTADFPRVELKHNSPKLSLDLLLYPVSLFGAETAALLQLNCRKRQRDVFCCCTSSSPLLQKNNVW